MGNLNSANRERPFSTFSEVLRTRAGTDPTKRAFLFLDAQGRVADERTFAQLDLAARMIASKLNAERLSGARVVLLFPSCLEFVDAIFGCFYAGAVAVPAPVSGSKRGGDRAATILRDCQAAAVLTLSSVERNGVLASGEDFGSSSPVWINTDELLTPAPSESSCGSGQTDALAILQYTSGSTGTPKAVMLTQANLIANSSMIGNAFEHSSLSRGVSWLPLFHDMGLVGHVLHPVHVGALSVLMSPLSFVQRPLRWLQAISEWKATTSGAPSYAFDLCIRMVRPEQMQSLDLRSWRVAYCGSERINAEVLERFAEKFAPVGFQRSSLYPCYGLAEATLLVSAGKCGAGLQTIAKRNGDETQGPGQRIVNCGHARDTEIIRIVDPGSGAPATEGETGEVWVKGANVGIGYWRQVDATVASFQARLGTEQGNFLRTGDLGFLQNGELYIVGRIKDTIIIRGQNYLAQDIEATVAASHPAFARLFGAAFGIQAAGAEHAVVVQEIAKSAISPSEQAAAIEAGFRDVVRDHGIRLYDLVLVKPGAVPRTINGKISRPRSRVMYESGEFGRANVGNSRGAWLGRLRDRPGEFALT